MLSRLDVEEDDHLARVQGPVYGADLGHRDPHDEVEDGCVHPEVNCDEVRREAGPTRQRAEERGRHALCKEEGAAGRSEDRERVLSHDSSGGGHGEAHPPVPISFLSVDGGAILEEFRVGGLVRKLGTRVAMTDRSERPYRGQGDDEEGVLVEERARHGFPHDTTTRHACAQKWIRDGHGCPSKYGTNRRRALGKKAQAWQRIGRRRRHHWHHSRPDGFVDGGG